MTVARVDNVRLTSEHNSTPHTYTFPHNHRQAINKNVSNYQEIKEPFMEHLIVAHCVTQYGVIVVSHHKAIRCFKTNEI